MLIIEDYGPLLRAKRQWARRDERARWRYRRHRWQVEGKHGEAKTQHGLRRAVRRGLGNVAIQVYLTASVMNLKVLVGLLSRLLARLWSSQDVLVELEPLPKRDFNRDPMIDEHPARAA